MGKYLLCSLLMSILLLFIPISPCNAISRYHTYGNLAFTESVDPKILNSVRVIMNKGILFEPSGQYLTYSGTIAVPFVYTVPGLNLKSLPEMNCSMHGSIQQLHSNMISHIKDILLVESPPVRLHKRQIAMPIALGIQGVLTLFNTYETFSLQSSITALKDNTELIKTKITDIQTTTNLLITRTNAISVIVGDHSSAIIRLAHKMDCLDYYISVEYQTIVSLISGIPEEFISAYDAGITGHLHPDLLSAKSAKLIIQGHPEMKNTLYARNTALVYELGKVLITDAIFDNQPHLKGVLYFPKLLVTSPLPMYNVYTVNYIHEKTNHRIVLPEKMVCSGDDTRWDVDETRCIVAPSKLVCLQGHYHVVNQCIRSIYNNRSMNCIVHVSSDLDDTSIYQLGPGILIGGHTKEIKTMEVHESSVSPLRSLPISNSPILVTANTTPYLIINDELYSTKITGIEYQLLIDVSIFPQPSILPHIQVPGNWTPIELLDDSWADWKQVSSGFGNILVSFITTLVTLGLVYLITRVINKSHRKKLVWQRLTGQPGDFVSGGDDGAVAVQPRTGAEEDRP